MRMLGRFCMHWPLLLLKLVLIKPLLSFFLCPLVLPLLSCLEPSLVILLWIHFSLWPGHGIGFLSPKCPLHLALHQLVVFQWVASTQTALCPRLLAATHQMTPDKRTCDAASLNDGEPRDTMFEVFFLLPPWFLLWVLLAWHECSRFVRSNDGKGNLLATGHAGAFFLDL